MNIVNIGEFNVVLTLPENSQLMAAWSARWTFGRVKSQNGSYIDQLPLIRDQRFWSSLEPNVDLAVPNTFPALVVELKTVPLGGRTSARTFPSTKHHIVATADDKAWLVPTALYWGALHRSWGADVPNIDLSNIKSFALTSLIGEDEFKKMILTLKGIVRKL